MKKPLYTYLTAKMSANNTSTILPKVSSNESPRITNIQATTEPVQLYTFNSSNCKNSSFLQPNNCYLLVKTIHFLTFNLSNDFACYLEWFRQYGKHSGSGTENQAWKTKNKLYFPEEYQCIQNGYVVIRLLGGLGNQM